MLHVLTQVPVALADPSTGTFAFPLSVLRDVRTSLMHLNCLPRKEQDTVGVQWYI